MMGYLLMPDSVTPAAPASRSRRSLTNSDTCLLLNDLMDVARWSSARYTGRMPPSMSSIRPRPSS